VAPSKYHKLLKLRKIAIGFSCNAASAVSQLAPNSFCCGKVNLSADFTLPIGSGSATSAAEFQPPGTMPGSAGGCNYEFFYVPVLQVAFARQAGLLQALRRQAMTNRWVVAGVLTFLVFVAVVSMLRP
jgi:hypothetical protein